MLAPPRSDNATQQQLRQACAELDRCLRAGEGRCAEDLLAEFPAVAAHPESALELIYTEFVVREELGQRPMQSAWYERFPQWQDDLRQLFLVHALVCDSGAGEPTIGSPTSAPANQISTWHGEDEGPGVALPRLEAYEVLSEIARGGMGVVYKARQPGLDRLVALKMIRAGAGADREELARFHTEAAAVACLQHPNIVQIYEVGEWQLEAGSPPVPFLALEFVDGGSLQQRLATAVLPPHQAAALLETLARAVHHAHQQGILHRDLKPANVLLSAAGVPKIADFGLAKRLGAGGAGHTRTGAVLGTPSYMPPEQADGKGVEVGPAADVYALGAILYEALTGRPPFQGESPLHTLELVRTQEPVPPSRLQPKVPRDLETICLKCLRKEPGRRYATAEALADDLCRFQSGQPIRARPVGLIERAVKRCRRRPARAALVAVTALALATLLVVSLRYNALLLGALETTKERAAEAHRAGERAERHLQKARQVVDLLSGEIIQPHWRENPQLGGRRRELLQEALEYYKGFLLEKPADPTTRFHTARAYYHLALCLAEQHVPADAVLPYLGSIELLDNLVAEFPTNRQYSRELSISLGYLGHAYRTVGQGPKAEQAYLRAIALVEPLLGETPSDHDPSMQLAHLLLNRCVVMRNEGRFAEAEKDQGRALALQRAVLKELPADVGYLSELALSLDEMSSLMRVREPPHLRAAADYGREAFALRQRLTKLSDTAFQHQALAATCLTLGELLRTTSRHAEAVPVYLVAQRSLNPLVTKFPNAREYREQLVQCQSGLGHAFLRTGKAAEAMGAYRQALATYDGLPQAGKLAGVPRHEAAMSANNLACTLLRAGGRKPGELAEALAVAKRAVQLAPSHGPSRQTLAQAQFLAKDYKAAIATYAESTKLKELGAQQHFHNALTAARMGNAQEALRSYNAGVRQMTSENSVEPALVRLQAEVETLLGIGARPGK